MYEKLSSKSGTQAVIDWMGTAKIDGTADGLVELTPADDHSYPIDHIILSDRLRDWLLDLHLLRHLPLAYLVPDERLLPAEAIRFFHVDQGWIDRVIDGAVAAANVGTV